MDTPRPAVPESNQDTLVIDPVRMNIVNRVAAGTELNGQFDFKGGLLLQGTLRGSGEIAGRLVVWHSGQITGRFRVIGDLYVLGQLGEDADATDERTLVECLGTVFVASTGVCTGHLAAPRLRMYDGATLRGPFRTLRADEAPPVLSTVTAE
jgi:hypothetical protein